jgi:cytochrome P450 family 142 subfamily A polypeptide 1
MKSRTKTPSSGLRSIARAAAQRIVRPNPEIRLLARYADIMEVSKNWEVFGSGQGSRPDLNVPSMINFDPPQHILRRQIVSSGFTPRRVQEDEPFLRRIVNDLIDAVAEGGECDFVREIATPLPMYMIGALMELPESDHEQLLEWSDLFATGGEEVAEEVGPAVEAYAEYIRKIVDERRGGDAEDLVSLVVNTDVDGQKLTDVDLIMETMLILVGGDETTRHVISGGLEALLRNPEQLEALRRDPLFSHPLSRKSDRLAFACLCWQPG